MERIARKKSRRLFQGREKPLDDGGIIESRGPKYIYSIRGRMLYKFEYALAPLFLSQPAIITVTRLHKHPKNIRQGAEPMRYPKR